jgi:hypothetical protein
MKTRLHRAAPSSLWDEQGCRTIQHIQHIPAPARPRMPSPSGPIPLIPISDIVVRAARPGSSPKRFRPEASISTAAGSWTGIGR